jgi:FtsH-binding integral membrane protein
MSFDSKYFRYVITTGILSTIIAVLGVMIVIVSAGTLTFSQVFNLPTILGTIVLVCVTFYLLSFFLSHNVIEKIHSKTGLLLYIAFAVFASIELFNIILSVLTHSTYYPSDPAFYRNFWISRLINLIISCVATSAVAYITQKNLNELYK